MSNDDDDLARRKSLTFEQAEGTAELPRQLDRKELSPNLRATLWYVLHEAITVQDGRVTGNWNSALRRFHIFHEHKMVDDFDSRWHVQSPIVRSIIEHGDFVRVYGFLQFILRENLYRFNGQVEAVLRNERAGYRVVDGDTLIPIGSDEEARAVAEALVATRSFDMRGARAHLVLASAAMTSGDWAGSIRESMNAVESVAKKLAKGSRELGPALTALEQAKAIHPALKRGFSAVYGFTSDEKGLRHPLLDEPVADVDEADAMFLLGACASFVSYLISKGRTSGLLGESADQ